MKNEKDGYWVLNQKLRAREEKRRRGKVMISKVGGRKMSNVRGKVQEMFYILPTNWVEGGGDNGQGGSWKWERGGGNK